MMILWVMVLVAAIVTAWKIREQRRRRRRITIRWASRPGEVIEIWR